MESLDGTVCLKIQDCLIERKQEQVSLGMFGRHLG